MLSPRVPNLCLRYGDQITGARALLRDGGAQFAGVFDEVFCTGGLKILKAFVGAPEANAFAERWIGSIRRDCRRRERGRTMISIRMPIHWAAQDC